MSFIKNLFVKQIDRTIDSVIKTDATDTLKQELEEYVITDEIAKNLQHFLDVYNAPQDSNGVWISGFFGSGKSHLLKMLKYLLDNKVVPGMEQSPLEVFLPKCREEFLKSDLRKAAEKPSVNVLFNVAQKADGAGQDNTDALLGVFVKVFNDICGYYADDPIVADFERNLDKLGKLADFKEAFAQISGADWEESRSAAEFFSVDISKAYAQITGNPEYENRDLLKTENYRVSIESFGEMVYEWIKKEEEKRGIRELRLNFFVDEIGQFIANNTKLMLNLQTISETFTTKCRGQVWLIVTAQEDLGTIVGDMNKAQGNDFSKIQDRFKTRLKLNSTDVEEVIQRRLFEKTEACRAELLSLYAHQQDNFHTLFTFGDGSRSFANFKDEKHFLMSYPVVPYQYDLFQKSLRGLSDHNAFTGKYTSVGARSMLGVFQQAVVNVGERSLGALVSFDLLFDGIHNMLKTEVQTAINDAIRNLDDDLAVRVLKCLLMVRYVSEFKASANNLAIMLLDGFHVNLSECTKKVQEVLNRLERETYIRREKNLYFYLTNEEKDIENEIKQVDVSTDALINELRLCVYDRILGLTKIRHIKTGADYPYTRILDGKSYGRDFELGVHIVTPYNEQLSNPSKLILNNMGDNSLLILMQEHGRVIDDLRLYKQTEIFVKQNQGATDRGETYQRLLQEKTTQNAKRFEEIKITLETLIIDARYYVNACEKQVKGGTPTDKLTDGVNILIDTVYTNLSMVEQAKFTEQSVKQILVAQHDADLNLPMTSQPFASAQMELLSKIRNLLTSSRVTLSSLIDELGKIPYGWSINATLGVLAYLVRNNQVEIELDGRPLDAKELARQFFLVPSRVQLVINLTQNYDIAQVQQLNRFYNEYFTAQDSTLEAKELIAKTQSGLKGNLDEIQNRLLSQKNRYPFIEVLEPMEELLSKVTQCAQKSAWLLTDFSQEDKDALCDQAENNLRPIRAFLSGTQREIYDAANKLLAEQDANLRYVDAHYVEEVRKILESKNCFRGNQMSKLKSHTSALSEALHQAREYHIAQAREKLDGWRNELIQNEHYQNCSADQQSKLLDKYNSKATEITTQQNIPNMQVMVGEWEQIGFVALLQKAEEWGRSVMREDPVIVVHVKELQVAIGKSFIENENDIDAYLSRLKEVMMVEIAGKKKIRY